MPPDTFLLPEFDHEMAVTRRLLERLPEEALGWKPHERSFSMAELATHLALLPRWGRTILDEDGYDLARSDTASPGACETRSAVLALFDDHVAGTRRRLAQTSAPELEAPWTLRRGSQTVMQLPRHAAFRRFLLDHAIHHRGQLSVYLRLQDVPLPPIYGPSADETL